MTRVGAVATTVRAMKVSTQPRAHSPSKPAFVVPVLVASGTPLPFCVHTLNRQPCSERPLNTFRGVVFGRSSSKESTRPSGEDSVGAPVRTK